MSKPMVKPGSSPVFANWSEQRAKLKAMFPVLTERDLRYEYGKKDVMLDRLYRKTGKTKEEFEALLKTL